MGSPKYAIGVDTGGTCTDAVLVQLAEQRIVAAVKRPTTHHDLRQGVARALAAVLEEAQIAPTEVSRVALSSTLATNAVVEDRGAPVGLLFIGPPSYVNLPGVQTRYVKGGHTWNGKEEDPLDLDDLAIKVESLRGQVDAYAVCSSFSVVDPTHELVASHAIRMLDPKPVFCSHEVSGKFGMRERAATAALNARLMPLMSGFLDAVASEVAAQGIRGEVLVVRGDGTVMSLAAARERAATTITSGPAASALFGAHAADLESALVVDVGGTTTDVAVLHHGRPRVHPEGSVVGPWKTHVEAVETFTVAIGGDSRAYGEYGRIRVDPKRVRPLCLCEGLPDLDRWAEEGVPPVVVLLSPGAPAELVAQDAALNALSCHGPATVDGLAAQLNLGRAQVSTHLRELVAANLVQEAGFTPTDALVLLGKLQLGDDELSRRGAGALGRRLAVSVDTFAERVVQRACLGIENAVLDHAIVRDLGVGMGEFLSRRNDGALVDVRIRLRVPMVGLGAAAPLLLGPVAAALGVDVRYPEHHEVGNAVGALLSALPAGGPNPEGNKIPR